MKILRQPIVTLLARPQFTEPAHLPVSWKGTSSDGERLAEFAGRLCYMSQGNPAGRTTAEYLDNILKQGHGSVFEHDNYSHLLEGSWCAIAPGSPTPSSRSGTWTSRRPTSSCPRRSRGTR
jgi:thymidylate synthase (FAD)